MSVPPGEELTGPSACNRTISVFDGVTRFDVELAYRRDHTAQTNGYAGPVTVCSARYTPIAGHRPDSSSTRYMANNHDISVWLAPLPDAHVVVPIPSRSGPPPACSSSTLRISRSSSARRARRTSDPLRPSGRARQSTRTSLVFLRFMRSEFIFEISDSAGSAPCPPRADKTSALARNLLPALGNNPRSALRTQTCRRFSAPPRTTAARAFPIACRHIPGVEAPCLTFALRRHVLAVVRARRRTPEADIGGQAHQAEESREGEGLECRAEHVV